MTNKHAFSLVEILVALSILGLSLSFFAYFSDALKLTGSAKQEAEITAYSFNYLQGLRASWQNLENFESSVGLKAENSPEGFEVEIKCEEKKSRITKKDFGIVDVVSLRTVTIRLHSKEEKIDDFLMSTMIARPVVALNEE